MAKVRIKRGTRAQIDAAAAGGTLVAGEPYLITDEGRFAVGTSVSAYSSFAKEGEVAAPIEVVARPVNMSPASGATGVSRTATLTGNTYASSTGVAQGAVRVQVSATSDFSVALLYDSGEKPPGNAVALPGGTLSNGIAVNWRIAHKSASGQWSDWSPPTAFTTIAVDIVMTGGTLTSSAGHNTHTFTASGSLVVPVEMTANVLVVAGGGSGGNGVGGGGGGGGVRYLVAQTLSAGTYAVTVAAGGAAPVGSTASGYNGGSSSIGSLATALGGGGGGGNSLPGLAGGSGGGGAGGALGGAGTASQGFAGGSGSAIGIGSGGGGGGEAGKNSASGPAGAGGAGFACGISPAATHYAGGGGGGCQSGYGTQGGAGGPGGGGAGAMTAGSAGAANSGGGGGSGGYNGTFYAGGSGGSGIVIIRYQA